MTSLPNFGTQGTGARSNDPGLSFTTFMTRVDFENAKHDPMMIIERGTQFISFLEQQHKALTEENRILQALQADSSKISFSKEQHAALVEHAAELELDHRELSQKYVDLENSNKMMQGVVDALRSDKQRLLEELNVLKHEQSQHMGAHSRIIARHTELEELRVAKEARLRLSQEEINRRIRDLDDLSSKTILGTQRTIELQDATEKIGSGRLALEAETVALEHTTQQQERTLQYLQNEVFHLDNLIKGKADEMVQLKKSMSAAILELQLQITKSEEEMSRIRTTVANEKDLTGRQNLWLAKDLQSKGQELLMNRQEMTKENATLKAELTLLREKSARLKSNVFVIEKRNQVLQDDLRRLESEDGFQKSAYLQRKESAFQEMNDQAAVVSKLNAELQTVREDLFVIKSRMCKVCRENILAPVPGRIM